MITQRGFTLIELMMVLAVSAILASIAVEKFKEVVHPIPWCISHDRVRETAYHVSDDNGVLSWSGSDGKRYVSLSASAQEGVCP